MFRGQSAIKHICFRARQIQVLVVCQNHFLSEYKATMSEPLLINQSGLASRCLQLDTYINNYNARKDTPS